MMKSVSLLFLALLLAGALLGSAAAQGSLGPFHPMDALTPQEVQLGAALLRKADLADERTLFATARLEEMPKPEVLSWKPGKPFSRRGFYVLRRDRRTFEALVDLTTEKVVSHREIPNVQPSITTGEWEQARKSVKSNPRWQQEMRKLGYSDLSKLSCTPIGIGGVAKPENGKRRILKVPCFDTENGLDFFQARPIDHVIATVDADTGEVIDIIVGQEVRPPKQIPGYNNKPTPRRAPLRPVVNIAPEGANFSLRGGIEVAWQNWNFHMRNDRRSGLVISLARFKDGAQNRLIAYQMALSEVYVPYMDPAKTWSFKAFMDAGEYGLGYLISRLSPGRDCPHNAVYIDGFIPSDLGGMFRASKAVCVFERNTGNPAWRHYDNGSDKTYSAPQVELVVRMIPTIGNYDYIVDYVFQLRGTIEVRIGATGLDALKMVSSARADSPGAKSDMKFGNLIAPYTVAPNHDHYFSFRLDLDVDGPQNTLLIDQLKLQTTSPGNPRRTLWTVGTSPMIKEGIVNHGAKRKRVFWRLINPNRKTALGHFPGYWLVPNNPITSLLSPDDPPQKKALFSGYPLWITRRKPRELWAAGDFPNQGPGGQGLPKFVSNRESVVNEDVVLWYNIGFHHLTLPEDFPIFPTMWHSFKLRPANFFNRNPAHDLSPVFLKPERKKQGS